MCRQRELEREHLPLKPTAPDLALDLADRKLCFDKVRGNEATTHMTNDITLTLSSDEALVLSGFFVRFEQTDDFGLRHNAEYLAFSRISARLDKILVEPLQPEYAELLEAARQRVSAGYEGTAPGVVTSDP